MDLGLCGRLRLESHFLQQPFDAHQSLIAFNGKVKRLAHQLLMLGIQESDDGTWFAKVAPGTLKDIALPLRLFSG